MRGVPRIVWSLSCFLMCRIPVLAAGGRAWPGPEARGVEMAVTASSGDRFCHLALLYHGRGEYVAAGGRAWPGPEARGSRDGCYRIFQ